MPSLASANAIRWKHYFPAGCRTGRSCSENCWLPILYGWGIAEAGLLLAVPTINLAKPGPVWSFYPPQIFLGCLLVPLLAAGLMAG